MQTSSPAYPHSTELAADFKRTVPFLRIDTLQRLIDIVLAMISAQNVNHLKLSPHMPGTSSVEAKKRRVERGVGDEQLTMRVFLALILTRIPPGKWLLSLDRTNWDYGESPMNLLILGVVMDGYTIPLVWDALEHTGNSDTHTCMWLVSQLLRVFPASRWRGLVADREFIGAEWFRFLRKSRIKRAVRVKKNTVLDGLRASEWFDDIAQGQSRCLAEKAPVFGEVMQVTLSSSRPILTSGTRFPCTECAGRWNALLSLGRGNIPDQNELSGQSGSASQDALLVVRDRALDLADPGAFLQTAPYTRLRACR